MAEDKRDPKDRRDYIVRVYRVKEMAEVKVSAWSKDEARAVAMRGKNKLAYGEPDSKYFTDVAPLPMAPKRGTG
jgi:hypothetical protein